MTQPGDAGRRWFWLGVVLGWPLIAVGAFGILRDSGVSAPVNFAVWFVGGNLVHDLVFAPLVLLGGVALRRVVPSRFLGPVQWASALTGIVALFALIPLAGWGRRAVEPTVQPLNYAVGFVVIVAAVWAAAAVSAAVRR